MRVEEERMKESWMDKLIELLNEYEVIRIKEANNKKEVWNMGRYTPYRYTKQVIEWFSNTIISKRYWFIQWLVQNDKIDRDRILKENWQFRLFYYDLERVKDYDRLVMYLSVEDNPIGFLISILN